MYCVVLFILCKMSVIRGYCRLCASKKPQVIDVSSTEHDWSLVLKKIHRCVSIQMEKENTLPKVICSECLTTINEFHEFREKCQQAEDKLKVILFASITKIKEEIEEKENAKQDSDLSDENAQFDSEFRDLGYENDLKIIKPEVEKEYDDDDDDDEGGDEELIQIISEKVIQDVKQPIIEVITENQQNEPETLLLDSSVIVDIKLPEVIETPLHKTKKTRKKKEKKVEKPKIRKERKKTKINWIYDGEDIDEKYFFEDVNEPCIVDMEEMEAAIKKKEDPNCVFECNKCGNIYKTYKAIKKHRLKHDLDAKGPFKCNLCVNERMRNFEFQSFKTLQAHVTRVHNRCRLKRYKCDRCNRRWPSQGELNAHVRKVHDASGAVCQICSKTFRNRDRLKAHRKVHNDAMPYVCDQCGRRFKWGSAFKAHIQSHQGEKNFLCSDCGKKFSTKKNLIEHVNIHSGTRPYICQYCLASFIQLASYKRHVALHDNGRLIHKCDKCTAAFSIPHLLKKHQIKHSDLRPYVCQICLDTFKYKGDLASHSKKHEDKQYTCEVCERKFTRAETLRDHMVRHTGIKHQCPAPGCGRTYTQRFPLTKHFCKNHPDLIIVNRQGGKKVPHLGVLTDNQAFLQDSVIRYEYQVKQYN